MSTCFPVCARKRTYLPILELLPPPTLSERRHCRLTRRLVAVVGDMVEEPAHSLYDAAARLGVPVFIFQEGPDVLAAQVFGEMARLTKGAHLKFAARAPRTSSPNCCAPSPP